jgi:hypothetical protein
MTENDQDLRDRFAALRRDEETRAPGFAAMSKPSTRQVRRRSPARLIAATTLLTAVIAVALWLSPAGWNHEFWNRELWRPHRDQGSQVASITKWKSPTDFLLQTPGSELLRTVPDLGILQPEAETTTPGNKHAQARTKILP